MSLNHIYYEQRDPYVGYRDDCAGEMPLRCSPHLHREIELVYFLEGEAVAYADSKRCELHPGDLYLSFPNQVHYYEHPRMPLRYLLFIFSPDLLPEYSKQLLGNLPHSPVICGAGDIPRVDGLLRMLGEACENSSLRQNNPLVRGYLLALFSELLPHMTISRVSAEDSGALRSIVDYCTHHFSENLSLSLLEEKLHLNKYYISHLFSERLKIRFNDYVNSLRVSEACRYLVGSDHSITRISATVGFNTLRTFNRAFIKQMGCSPSEYRRRESIPTQRKKEAALYGEAKAD